MDATLAHMDVHSVHEDLEKKSGQFRTSYIIVRKNTEVFFLAKPRASSGVRRRMQTDVPVFEEDGVRDARARVRDIRAVTKDEQMFRLLRRSLTFELSRKTKKSTASLDHCPKPFLTNLPCLYLTPCLFVFI